STGSGFGTRQLYSDDGEKVFGGARPICLNGIEEFTDRADLLDRAIPLHLPAISDEHRRDEQGFWGDFEQIGGIVLGGLLDAVSRGLRNCDTVKLGGMPRMADFAKWIVACEAALPWTTGAFLEAYETNRDEAIEVGLEASPIAPLIQQLATN